MHMKSWAIGGVLLGSLPLVGCAPSSDETREDAADAEAGAQVCASGPTTVGIDVSEFQGAINWSQVKSGGVGYAFIRVSDGTGYPDQRFAANWAGAKSAGVRRGAYQFFRPSEDPVAQASLFLSSIGELGDDDLPPVLDLESADGMSDATVVSRARTWLTLIEEGTNRRPLVYTAQYFWNGIAGGDQLGDYPLWVANYGVSCPNLPATWSSWAFWQYTDSGSVSGIFGPVDKNRFHGSAAELAQFVADSKVGYELPIEVYWARQASGAYELRALAAADVARVEYFVDGYPIGAASRQEGDNFPDSYTFGAQTTKRAFEVLGFDSQEKAVARGVGLIDTVSGTAVYIRQMGDALYEVGLERAPAGVHAIEVRADGFLLTDSVSGAARSTRRAVRSKFFQLGPRRFSIDTFNADGSKRGTLTRDFVLE